MATTLEHRIAAGVILACVLLITVLAFRVDSSPQLIRSIAIRGETIPISESDIFRTRFPRNIPVPAQSVRD